MTTWAPDGPPVLGTPHPVPGDRHHAATGWHVTFTSTEAPGASIIVHAYPVTKYQLAVGLDTAFAFNFIDGYAAEARVTYRTARGPGVDEYDTESETRHTLAAASADAEHLAAYYAHQVAFTWDGYNLLEDPS